MTNRPEALTAASDHCRGGVYPRPRYSLDTVCRSTTESARLEADEHGSASPAGLDHCELVLAQLALDLAALTLGHEVLGDLREVDRGLAVRPPHPYR